MKLKAALLTQSRFFCRADMKQQIGTLMQLFVLGALPALIYFQLIYGVRLLVMPISLLIGIVVFAIGTSLRNN